LAFLFFNFVGTGNLWSGYLADDVSVGINRFSAVFGSTARRNVPFCQFLNTVDPAAGWGALIDAPSAAGNDSVTINVDNNGTGNLSGGDASNTLRIESTYLRLPF